MLRMASGQNLRGIRAFDSLANFHKPFNRQQSMSKNSVFALLNNESLQNQFQRLSDQLIAVKAEGTLNYELKNFTDAQQNFEEALAIFTEI